MSPQEKVELSMTAVKNHIKKYYGPASLHMGIVKYLLQEIENANVAFENLLVITKDEK